MRRRAQHGGGARRVHGALRAGDRRDGREGRARAGRGGRAADARVRDDERAAAVDRGAQGRAARDARRVGCGGEQPRPRARRGAAVCGAGGGHARGAARAGVCGERVLELNQQYCDAADGEGGRGAHESVLVAWGRATDYGE